MSLRPRTSNALLSMSCLCADVGVVKPIRCGAAAAELIAVNAFEAFILFEE